MLMTGQIPAQMYPQPPRHVARSHSRVRATLALRSQGLHNALKVSHECYIIARMAVS